MRSLKLVAFFIIIIMLFSGISSLLVNPGDFNYQLVSGFFQETEGSLDAVLIGASPTYTFWSAPLAWGKYGIAVRPCAAQGMPIEAVPYFLKEASKQQHDSLFIITINALNKDLSKERIHWSTDYFPNSFNKFQMIDCLTSEGKYSWDDKVPMFIPAIQYKTRWSSLRYGDFHYELDGLKTGMHFDSFLQQTMDLSDKFVLSNETTELSANASRALEDTLDYCDSEHLDAVFILFPQCQEEEIIKQYNKMIYIIRARGYECINLLEDMEGIGLDVKVDFYDEQHTNIHGALKTTDYLSQYLLEHYDFPEKAGGVL